MQRTSTCLWFDGQGLDAAKLYVSLIPNSRIITVNEAGGKVMTVLFSLDGTEYLALNGGPQYKLSPAASIMVFCDDQDEVDRLWAAFLEGGGVESRCGWLTDKFGLSWQIIPRGFMDMMKSSDKEAVGRAFQAMLTMTKLHMPTIQKAYDGG
ncbi:MAG: VOC family protein [Polyangiaceae bacterium]|nr:VOC family protein [Polyangiaceae bacterium]